MAIFHKYLLKSFLLIFASAGFLCSCSKHNPENLTQWVDPFIGTVNYIDEGAERMGMERNSPLSPTTTHRRMSTYSQHVSMAKITENVG